MQRSRLLMIVATILSAAVEFSPQEVAVSMAPVAFAAEQIDCCLGLVTFASGRSDRFYDIARFCCREKLKVAWHWPPLPRVIVGFAWHKWGVPFGASPVASEKVVAAGVSVAFEWGKGGFL